MRPWQIKKRNADLERELRADLELEEEEQRERGLAPDEARYAALRAFGNPTSIRQQTHEVWSWIWLESLARDVSYGLRRLRRSPGFASIVVLTLALGIGANTAIFTLVQGILLRSLPVADPSRLYRIGDRTHCCYFNTFESDDGDFDLFSYDLYRRFQEVSPEFEQLAAVQAGGATFTVRRGGAPATALRAEYVSGNYFTTLGIGAYAGRPLSPNDDRIGAAPALVLSYQAWQREFNGEPGIIGSTLYLEHHAFTVAGIAPPDFYGDRIAPFPPDMWMPLASEPLLEGANSSLRQPDTAWLYVVGRLRADANLNSLQARLSGVLRQWMASLPAFTDHGGASAIPKQHVVLSPAGGGIQKIQQQTGTGLRILMLLSSVVLLIACANIANLLLVRSMAQRAEIAVRIGLGASRGRIIRQIVTESLMLSMMGGAAGLVVALLGYRTILVLAFPLSQNMPLLARPSWGVLLFAILIPILTGLLFALVPGWVSSGTEAADASRGNSGLSRDRASIPQRLLLVFQLALSIVLLTSAFLATRSLYKLEHQRTGIETEDRYTVQIDLKGSGYTPDQLDPVYRKMEDGLSALPGIAYVSFARYLPLEGNEWGSCVIIKGRPVPAATDPCFSDWNRVSLAFLNSIGVPVLRGRGFIEEDETSRLPVAMVNQAFVRRFFPNQDALGQHFGINGGEYAGAFEIVGVFADFKLSDARREAQPLFLRPLGQLYSGYKETNSQAAEASSLYLNRAILQFDRPQQDAEQLVRTVMARIDPSIPVIRVTPYPEVVAGNFNQDRLLARLTEAFGILALMLASVGLYGVMSYLAVRRTTEIGIRMAMGSSRSGIISLMLRSASLQVLAGLLIGVPASVFVCRMMQHLLYQVSSQDPLTFLSAISVLCACIGVAAIVPAVRAASVDPMQALRME
jgi:macrolide transport system ATP-binding/permease protein